MGESSQHVNFNRYSFFPTDNDENQSEERGRRCSALSMLSFSSMEESSSFPATEDQRDINTFTAHGCDRRRSSTLSILSFLAKEQILDDLVTPYSLGDNNDNSIHTSRDNVLNTLISADRLTSMNHNALQEDITPYNINHDHGCVHNTTSTGQSVFATNASTEESVHSSTLIAHRQASDRPVSATLLDNATDDIIIPTDLDVLFGRGQTKNKHPGNQRFRELVNSMRPIYFAQGKSKKKKHALSEQVVEAVYAYGGRFLEVVDDGASSSSSAFASSSSFFSTGGEAGVSGKVPVYKEVDRKRARKKCSQRLRETCK